MTVKCPICSAPGMACGDSHQTLPLLTGEAYYRGATMTREELQEYHYYVSGMEMSAMLTPRLAERLNAKPIDEPLDSPNTLENNEANRMSSQTGTANTEGVTTKARTTRNKAADGT